EGNETGGRVSQGACPGPSLTSGPDRVDRVEPRNLAFPTPSGAPRAALKGELAGTSPRRPPAHSEARAGHPARGLVYAKPLGTSRYRGLILLITIVASE